MVAASAASVLHNICLMNEDDIDDFLDKGDDGSDNGDDDDGLFPPPRCRRGGKAKSNCKAL